MDLLVVVFLVGCTAARPQSGVATETELALNGDDTRQQLSIHTDQTISPDEAEQLLADQEMCYLQLDEITVECFPFGSLLMMGQGDAVKLVYDNPLDDLHVDEHDPHGESMLRTLAVVSVIADSVERLPGALADYIDDNSAINPGVAVKLARRLIDSSSAKIDGMSRAGPLSIKLELTEDGKEELREALSDRETGGLQLAHHLHRSHLRHRVRPIPTSAVGGVPSPGALR
jgi:hypothetical protein